MLAPMFTVAFPRSGGGSSTYRRVLPDNLGVDDCDPNNDTSLQDLYARWAAEYGFETNETSNDTLACFRETVARVKTHRTEYMEETHSFLIGLNQFSATCIGVLETKIFGRKRRLTTTQTTSTTTESQQSRKKRSRNIRPKPRVTTTTTTQAPAITDSSAYLNWTQLGYVTPVKNQGNCGCCWAFAATGAMEGAYYKATKTLVSFSEEQLAECIPEFRGCGGGDEEGAYEYVMEIGGDATEANYPYTAGNGRVSRCRSSSVPQVSMTLVDYQEMEPNDEAVLNGVTQYGPLSVDISVTNGFQNYMSGVAEPSKICGGAIDHSVLLVGYGTDALTSKPYWLLKNSWGTSWGEQGYFRLDRSIANACNINYDANAVFITVP